MSKSSALVFEIVRGTTHDGPGMRTTVFLKGCPLRCTWCQNPEGISQGRQISWEASRCIRCLRCIEACPADALCDQADGIRRDTSRCVLCGACVDACPSRAMEWTADEWNLDSLVREALKDLDYYRAFGGGVTVSGGEPLSQHGFVRAFFRELRSRDVHTALDTCGLASGDALAGVLEFADHVLFDVKFVDEELHRQFTGHPNALILQNLEVVAEAVRRDGLKLWIRTPLIPRATATGANLEAIGTLIADRYADVVERWELCAFNRACVGKYRSLGQPWEYEDEPTMTQKAVDELRRAALTRGLDHDTLVVSGLTTADVC